MQHIGILSNLWGVLVGSLAFYGHIAHHWPAVYKTGSQGERNGKQKSRIEYMLTSYTLKLWSVCLHFCDYRITAQGEGYSMKCSDLMEDSTEKSLWFSSVNSILKRFLC